MEKTKLNTEFEKCFHTTLIGGNEKSCPSSGLRRPMQFTSVLSGKSKMTLLERFPNQNLTRGTWRLFS